MRTAFLLATALLLQSCSDRQPPAAAYLHFRDQVRALGGGSLGIPCSTHVKTKHGEIEQSAPIEDCLRFQPPKRMTGIWLTEFEASRFIKDAKRAPMVWRWTINDIDLVPAADLPTQFASLAYAPPRRAFLVTFIGREVLYPIHNRWGGKDNTVVIDRMISLKQVQAPDRAELCLPKCKPI